MIKVMAYNPMFLFRSEEPERTSNVIEAIRVVKPHVLLVQELAANTPEQAITSARRLASLTGMKCEIDRGPGRDVTYTVAKGSRNHAVAVLWDQRAGVKPVPDSWRVIKDVFWHAIGILTLEVEGVLVDHASYHAPPRDGRTNLAQVQWERDTEAMLIAALAKRPGRLPLLIGADWNGLSADKIGNDEYYAVRYLPEDMNPAVRALELNRHAGEIMLASGIVDVNAAKFDRRKSRQLTTGHWEKDSAKPGIIDGFRATRDLVAAVRTCDVINNAITRAASDHLPSVAEYDPSAIRMA